MERLSTDYIGAGRGQESEIETSIRTVPRWSLLAISQTGQQPRVLPLRAIIAVRRYSTLSAGVKSETGTVKRKDKGVITPKAIFQFVLSHLGWLRWCFFVSVVVLSSGRLASQTATDKQTQVTPLRFDLTALVGYRTSMNFPTGQDAQQLSPHLILDAKLSYGMAAGVRLDEENLIEFRWARQNTDVHLEDSTAFSKKEVVLDQFHGDFTHEYILEEWPRWARPFVEGSIGATRVGGGASGSFTRFSFGLGGGIKVYPTRHLGLRVQGEWLPVVVNPEVKAFICGSGCIVHLSGTLVSQGEIVIGPVLRF